jgi:hypothetical protein
MAMLPCSVETVAWQGLLRVGVQQRWPAVCVAALTEQGLLPRLPGRHNIRRGQLGTPYVYDGLRISSWQATACMCVHAYECRQQCIQHARVLDRP